MAQQTAVEWFVQQLEECGSDDFKIIFKKQFEQAKAMEKEQIINAFFKGRQEEQYRNLFNNHVRISEEQYYKDTYESNN